MLTLPKLAAWRVCLRYRVMLPSLVLIFPIICVADIDKDLRKCRESHNATARAACFQKLIPRLDERSREIPADTSWAEALKEAYEATIQLDKLSEAARRIQIGEGAKKLISSVLEETNSKAQAYAAVAQYYEALGPEWEEAAKRAEGLEKAEQHENGELPPSIKRQIAEAVNAVQPKAQTPSHSASIPLILHSGIELQNECIKSPSVSDEGSPSGRHVATVTVRNSCSQALTIYLCVKSDRARCWTCKTISLNPGQETQGPSSIGFGDCTGSNCNGVSVQYNAATQGSPPKPNVDDSCQGKTR